MSTVMSADEYCLPRHACKVQQDRPALQRLHASCTQQYFKVVWFLLLMISRLEEAKSVSLLFFFALFCCLVATVKQLMLGMDASCCLMF